VISGDNRLCWPSAFLNRGTGLHERPLYHAERAHIDCTSFPCSKYLYDTWTNHLHARWGEVLLDQVKMVNKDLRGGRRAVISDASVW
jgi:hypothetical protein